jgi:hypothetical protein
LTREVASRAPDIPLGGSKRRILANDRVTAAFSSLDASLLDT